MIFKINTIYIKYIKICLISILVLTTTLITSRIAVGSFILNSIVISLYYLFLLSLNSEIDIVLHQIFMYIISNFVLDILFHYIKIDTPLEIIYLVEGISVILLMHILVKKKYNNLLRDPIVVISIIIIISSIFFAFIKHNNAISVFNAIRIYFRFLPTYIVFSFNNINLSKLYKLIYIPNIIVFFGQTLLGGHQDLRTGIWGIRGTGCFGIFIGILYIYILVKKIYTKSNFKNTIFIMILTLLMFVLNENKAQLLILILVSLIILSINNTQIFKKIILSIVIFILLIIGWDLMIKFNPKFSYLSDLTKLNTYVQNHLFGNSNRKEFLMGRIEAGLYIRNNECETLIDEVFGLGLGESIVPENDFYVKDAKGRQEIFDFKESNIYRNYGSRLGYHLSGFNFIIIDGGYIGVIACILIFLVIIHRSIKLVIKGMRIDDKIIGAIGIYIFFTGVYGAFYSAGLINRGYMLMLCIILGKINNSLKISNYKI